MVTYYIGNVRNKRRLFREHGPETATADNCDVLADFKFGGKVCFVLGDIPYGDMRVGEYLAYARALKTQLPLSAKQAKELLRRVGAQVSLERKMSSLSRLVFRFVLLASVVDEDTEEVRINLDGIAYSRRTRRKMRLLVKRASRGYGCVRVAVSDYRFIPKSARVMAVTADGSVTEGKTKSMSRRYCRMRFSRDKRKESLALCALSGRKTVLCDN